MNSTAPRTASGKVIWSFAMSVERVRGGPNHEMDWMTGFTLRPGLIDEYIERTGAVLGAETAGTRVALAASTATAEAVQIGREGARGKNLAVFLPQLKRPGSPRAGRCG